MVRSCSKGKKGATNMKNYLTTSGNANQLENEEGISQVSVFVTSQSEYYVEAVSVVNQRFVFFVAEFVEI